MKSATPLLKEFFPEHWFVVANQKTLKIFKCDDQYHMHLLHRIEGSQSHGRGKSPQHLENKKHQAGEENAIHFAREIARFLEAEKQAQHFATLTIAAEPRFLGKIKALLTPNVKSCVHSWSHKDLEKIPDRELAEHLIPETNPSRYQPGQLAL